MAREQKMMNCSQENTAGREKKEHSSDYACPRNYEAELREKDTQIAAQRERNDILQQKLDHTLELLDISNEQLHEATSALQRCQLVLSECEGVAKHLQQKSERARNAISSTMANLYTRERGLSNEH